MPDELELQLHEMATSSEFDVSVQELAASALRGWREGIIPSAKTLRVLASARTSSTDCARAGHDGSCPWLRKRGAGYGIPVPPAGEKAYCSFKSSQKKCPGYKKGS